MPHMPGHFRDEFCTAFEREPSRKDNEEWYDYFDSPEEAIKVLGQLWNCTDRVPRSIREEVAECLSPYISDDDYKSIIDGASYAQLVRRLKPAIEKELSKKAK